jgi:O-succinylbenzoic acid--CoA ligase
MERLELIRLLGARAALAEPVPLRVVEEREPDRFMAAFAQAVAQAETVLVCDPTWGTAERAQLALLQQSKIQNPKSKIPHGWLCLPTGGTSGQLRFARHDQDTLSAAVRGFCGHFHVTTVNAVGVLPLHHVSGLMAWMRCALTGGRYVPWDWKQLEAGATPGLPGGGEWFLSLVPTQLQRLLSQPAVVDRLRRFRAIFLGGGPAWPELLQAAATARLPLALSYGMTETAAMMAAQRPEGFLAGARSCGAVMPHAQIEISAEGLIRVGGDSLFRGYFPDWRGAGLFETEDLGHFEDAGHLHIDGRRDAVIITGGKKVTPAEVETALRATGQFADVAVVGVPDAEWGQIIVACHPANQAVPDLSAIGQMLSRDLAPYKRPKRYVVVDPWPRNAQGKIDRRALVVALSSPLY